jgi:RimJ/RimL family protein N-acetyltransferase
MESEFPQRVNELGQPIGFAVDDWRPPEPPSRQPMAGRTCRLEVLDSERHADDLHAANMLDSEHRIWTYLPYGPFESLGSYREWAGEVGRGSDPLFHAIIDTATEKAVGVASYLRINPAVGSIEVGHINYSPLLQRTPAATEAMYLMMRRVFESGYRRYEWKCDALNARSRAAAQRLGFSYEGIFRQATIYKGRNRDTAWYAIIDEEWPELDEAYRRWLEPGNFDDEGRQRLRLTELTGRVLKARG